MGVSSGGRTTKTNEASAGVRSSRRTIARAEAIAVSGPTITGSVVIRPPLETPTGKLLGVVHIQRMLREAPHTPVGAVVDSAVEAVRPEVHLSKVSRLMAAYNILAVPVVDSERRLLGAISIDDVLDHLLPEDWREGSDDADAPAGAGVADG